MKALVDIIRKQLPTRVTPSWRYNSRPILLDPEMRGVSRFGVQLSCGLGSISSRLNVGLTRRAGNGDIVLVTETLPEGLIVGAFIDIAREEQALVTALQQVVDATGLKLWHWTLDHALLNSFAVGAQVNFVAFPVTTIASVSVGDTTLTVDSPYFIVPGDQMFQLSQPATTFVSTQHVDVTAVSQIAQIDVSTMRWSLTIEPTTFDADYSSTLYIAANVAYRSIRVPLDDMSGPYLADLMGGKTFGSGSDGLLISLDFYGGNSRSTTVTRNELAVSAPIRAGDAALWSQSTGSIIAISLDEIEFKLDTSGNFATAFELPISTSISLDWIVKRGAGSFNLLADGVSVRSSDNLAWTGTVRRLELRLTGNANDTWRVATNPIRVGYRSVQYSYMISTKPEEVWNGTCVILKPLIKQLSNSLAHDRDGENVSVNSGAIIL
jgi:hypothetical protein